MTGRGGPPKIGDFEGMLAACLVGFVLRLLLWTAGSPAVHVRVEVRVRWASAPREGSRQPVADRP